MSVPGMTPIICGDSYELPSGLRFRVLEIRDFGYWRARIEHLSGKRIGAKRWENVGYLEAKARMIAKENPE